MKLMPIKANMYSNLYVVWAIFISIHWNDILHVCTCSLSLHMVISHDTLSILMCYTGFYIHCILQIQQHYHRYTWYMYYSYDVQFHITLHKEVQLATLQLHLFRHAKYTYRAAILLLNVSTRNGYMCVCARACMHQTSEYFKFTNFTLCPAHFLLYTCMCVGSCPTIFS